MSYLSSPGSSCPDCSASIAFRIWYPVLTHQLESPSGTLAREVREEEQPMPADPSGKQEPEEERFPFSLGQGVRIIEGPFTEYVGTISRIDTKSPSVW